MPYLNVVIIITTKSYIYSDSYSSVVKSYRKNKMVNKAQIRKQRLQKSSQLESELKDALLARKEPFEVRMKTIVRYYTKNGGRYRECADILGEYHPKNKTFKLDFTQSTEEELPGYASDECDLCSFYWHKCLFGEGEPRKIKVRFDDISKLRKYGIRISRLVKKAKGKNVSQ